jgi:Alphavirus core protein.
MTKVFPILKANPNIQNTYIICGNGFFIDDYGTFITAGHVLRKLVDYYICLPDGNNMDLIPITYKRYYHRENYYRTGGGHDSGLLRERRYYQCGPEHKDVAIGKVDLTDTEYLEFIKKRPSISDNLTVNFFKPCRTYASTGIALSNNQIPNYYIETESVNLQRRDNKILSLVPYNDTDPRIYDEHMNYYNNCIWTNGSTGRGVSGSPVLDDNGFVVGMVIGGVERSPLTYVLLARYTKKTSNKLLKGII